MKDFLLAPNGDLAIQNGDLVIAPDSTLQHQADIIWAEKGWWHSAPALGVGLQSFLNENAEAPGLMASVRQELERDGMNVESIDIGLDGITIKAVYLEP